MGRNRRLKARGKTIILTTHYLDEAQQLADKVAIIDHGRIVAIGTSDEIIKQYGSGERLEIQGSEELANYIRTNTELDVKFSNGMISVLLKQKNDALEALEAAKRSNLDWGEMSTRLDSLEDVFVKLVGGVEEAHGAIISENDNSGSAGTSR